METAPAPVLPYADEVRPAAVDAVMAATVHPDLRRVSVPPVAG